MKNYKQRVIILLAGLLILLLLVYNLAISETLTAIQKSKELQLKLDSVANAPQEISQVKEKLALFSTQMGNLSDSVLRNEPFLEFISNTCKFYNTELADYSAPHIFAENDFKVETRIATIEGNFKNLLQLLQELEKKYSYGKTVSATFDLKEDLRNNVKHLYLTVYVQSIVNNKETNDVQ